MTCLPTPNRCTMTQDVVEIRYPDLGSVDGTTLGCRRSENSTQVNGACQRRFGLEIRGVWNAGVSRRDTDFEYGVARLLAQPAPAEALTKLGLPPGSTFAEAIAVGVRTQVVRATLPTRERLLTGRSRGCPP